MDKHDKVMPWLGGRMGHVIFSQYFGVGQQNLCPQNGVGYAFLGHHFSKCSGPFPLYLLTGP